MYILSVDSSTRFCSVAVHRDGTEVFSTRSRVEKSASSMLTVLVQTAADAAGIGLEAIDAFAVGAGPGSYTGLRVATSVVKGLCFALDKPLVAVNTLEAMALQVRKSVSATAGMIDDPALLFVPMIDARRMEVYCASFDYEGKMVGDTSAVIVESSSFETWLEKGRVVFFGDGAAKCRAVLQHSPNAVFWESEIHPEASFVGELACGCFLNGDLEDAAAFEPFYLKEFMSKPGAAV